MMQLDPNGATHLSFPPTFHSLGCLSLSVLEWTLAGSVGRKPVGDMCDNKKSLPFPTGFFRTGRGEQRY